MSKEETWKNMTSPMKKDCTNCIANEDKGVCRKFHLMTNLRQCAGFIRYATYYPHPKAGPNIDPDKWVKDHWEWDGHSK